MQDLGVRFLTGGDELDYLPERLGQAPGPSLLVGRVRDLVLPNFYLKMRKPTPERMEWSAVVHVWIQIVGLVVPHGCVPYSTQGGEHGIGETTIEVA